MIMAMKKVYFFKQKDTSGCFYTDYTGMYLSIGLLSGMGAK